MMVDKLFFGKSFTRSSCYLGFGTLIVLLMPHRTWAQLHDEARSYYEAEQYYVAAQMYGKVLQQDSTDYRAAWYLALSQRELYLYKNAEKHFGWVAQHAPDHYPKSLYYYAEALQRKRDFPSAVQWYEKYLALPATKQDEEFAKLARLEKEVSMEALLIPSRPDKIQLTRLPEPVNTQFEEFAPVVFPSDSVLVISSTQLEAQGPISNRSGQRFSDQFLLTTDTAGWTTYEDPGKLRRLNSETSEASGSFTRDGQQYFFTRCGEGDGHCRIYVSTLKNGRWQYPRLLPASINLSGTNNKHPAVSPAGDTLFFVSDRPGGLGKSDIWMSRATEPGHWDKPVRLGTNINTPLDEAFPYYLAEENLFLFVSEGREGPGGMDLYMIKLSELQNQTVVPLASPFNSTQDDCCLAVGKGQAYLASNRAGDFDIYAFQVPEKVKLSQLLMGIVYAYPEAVTGQKLAFQEVISDNSLLLEKDVAYLSVMHSDRQNFLSNGSSRFVLSADVNNITLENLRDQSALSQNDSSGSQVRLIDTLLTKDILASFSTRTIPLDEQVEIKGQLQQMKDFKGVPALRLYLVDQEGEVVKITTTNQEGAFRFVNIQAASSYQIVKSGGPDQEDYFFTYDVQSYGTEVQTIRFENIYFDFNQDGLRNEARVTLDELVSYYQQNPDAVIEINAFADTIGNDMYNLQLSRQRGLTAFDYLLQAGVDRTSLLINARGASTSVSSSNNFVSQQLNRRVELFVTGRGLAYESNVVTRVLRPKVTLYTLSQQTGMSIEEIKRLNGIAGNELQAYKPVRLYIWAAQEASSLFYQTTIRSKE